MRGSTKRALPVLLSLALCVALTVGIIVARRSDDSLASLSRASAAILADQRRESHGTRVFQAVMLSDARLGPITFTVSLPDPLPQKKLPLLVILGRLGTGENSTIDAASENAVIGYAWPLRWVEPVAATRAVR